jgi:hypothetical protein
MPVYTAVPFEISKEFACECVTKARVLRYRKRSLKLDAFSLMQFLLGTCFHPLIPICGSALLRLLQALAAIHACICMPGLNALPRRAQQPVATGGFRVDRDEVDAHSKEFRTCRSQHTHFSAAARSHPALQASPAMLVENRYCPTHHSSPSLRNCQTWHVLDEASLMSDRLHQAA